MWLWGSELCEHVVFCSAEKGVVFGSPLTEEGIAQVSQLIEYLHKSKWLCLLSSYPSGYLSGPPQVSGADRVTSFELPSSRSLGLHWATVPQNCLADNVGLFPSVQGLSVLMRDSLKSCL